MLQLQCQGTAGRDNRCHLATINGFPAFKRSVPALYVGLLLGTGIGNTQDGLHPVQQRLATSHGSQCGFCTPGFVMSMYALLRSTKGPPTEEDIEECLAGNLWCVLMQGLGSA